MVAAALRSFLLAIRTAFLAPIAMIRPLGVAIWLVLPAVTPFLLLAA